MLYCANTLDYEVFKPIQAHIGPISVLAKNKQTQKELKEYGVESTCYPAFPKAVIMCRQAAYKFPVSKIIKVGMRHGAYTFKPFANPKSYNLLDHFYMTSQEEVERAQVKGIKSAKAIGFPKIDPYFNGDLTPENLKETASIAKLDSNKPTVLFTATWNKSGISAIDKWFDKLASYTTNYNILVTVHPWTQPQFIEVIKQTPNVHFITSPDILRYIALADVCIGDCSSVLAECCALDKPIISFNVAQGKRTVPEAKEIINQISESIEHIKDLENAIKKSLSNPQDKQEQRVKANKTMFDQLDGKASYRAAQHLISLLPELSLHQNK